MGYLFLKRSTVLLKSLLEEETISFIFAGICIVLIPVYTWYIPPIIIAWVVLRSAEIIVNKKFLLQTNRRYLWLSILFIVFFFLQLTSLLFSDNLSNGANILFRRLSLLAFPVLFMFPGSKIISKGNSLLKLFAGSTVIFIIFCFLNALYKSISLQNGLFIINTHPPEGYWMSYFLGSYLSVNQHPSYLAMFVSLSVFIALESIFEVGLKKYKRILWCFACILLLVSIYLLSSRAGFLAISIALLFYFLFKLDYKKRILRKTLLVILLLFVTISIVRTNERITLFMEQFSDGTFREKIAKDSRILIWRSSIKIIKNNPVLGVGIGDAGAELMKEYLIIGDKDLIDSHYNAHNQFLEILLETGIAGLLVFLMIFGYMIYISLSEKNLIYGLFLLMMFIFFMFESVLSRLSGVAYFSLFSFLLIYLKPYNKI